METRMTSTAGMKAECKHPGCVRNAYQIGYCHAHYTRQRLGQDMGAPHRSDVSPEDRFWSKVDKTEGCWLWTAAKTVDGYGRFRLDGSPRLAHRVAYSWANGPIPKGLQLDHVCYVPACVNPDHLRLATNAENNQNRQGASSNSTSGVRGVFWNRAAGKWVAEVVLDGKHHSLGRFIDIADAEAVVTEWRRIHMPYSIMDQRTVTL